MGGYNLPKREVITPQKRVVITSLLGGLQTTPKTRPPGRGFKRLPKIRRPSGVLDPQFPTSLEFLSFLSIYDT